MKDIKELFFPLLIMIILTVVACTSQTTNGTVPPAGTDSKEIRIGFNPGPYRDEFEKGIRPILEKKGYKITAIEFHDGIQPNFALANGQLDANIFQHSEYLKSFIKQNKVDLTGVVQIPTPPMGLFSKKHKSINEIKAKQTITVPSDPTNVARALIMLERLGWIKIKENVNPITVSERDIIANRYELKLVPMELAQLPRSLDDADFSLVSGNYAYASGLRVKEALFLENMTSPYINVVTVRTPDKDRQFVKDIIEAYHSPEFRKIHDNDEQFKFFTRPDYLN